MTEWLKFKYNFKARFSDTDAYGVVHNSRYYCFFEEARYEFAKNVLGLYDDVSEAHDLKFPVIESSCTYRHAIVYTLEEMQLHLCFRILDNCKVEFLYEIRKEGDKRLFASGRTVHAIVENNRLCITVSKWLNEKVSNGFKESHLNE